MKVHSILVFVAVLLCVVPATAQLVNNDIAAHSMILNSGSKTTKIDKQYVNVQGKYLYDKDWHKGAVQMKPGNIFRMKQVKVNFLTNQLHYPEGDGEMAASIENMRKVVIFSNDDTTKVEATFLVLGDPAQPKSPATFFQVLNNGKIQLLKQTTVGTNKMRVDPIVGQSETVYFYSSNSFYIKNDDSMTKLDGLGKNSVFEALPEAGAGNEWLAANKNKLKKEGDIVAFLDYLNSKTSN